MRTVPALAAVAALGLLAGPVVAADNGIHLGASVGQSGVSFEDTIEGQDVDFDVDSTGFKAILGWRFVDWLAIEANYVDLGSGDDRVAGTKIETDVNGVSLSAVGFLPVGPVDFVSPVAPADVVGPVCETGDTFARGRALPSMTPGALVAFLDAGAYGAAMSSTYNMRPLAAEVLVDGTRFAVTRDRQSYEALLAGNRIPAWLEERSP